MELISVFMPAYNGAKYIKDSIQSVLDQTYSNFELIIVNDGSTDATVDIINSFQDSRIKLYHNDKNMGLAFTENRCLELCNGKYFAKLDCDDIALPTRLAKQKEYLDNNPDVGLLGSAVEVIDSGGNKSGRIWKYPANKDLIASLLLFHNYFAHPAVMLRKEALPKIKYRSDYNPAEDYDLWVRILRNGYKGFNLNEVLTFYRIHSSNISITQQTVQINSQNQTRKNQLNELGISLNENEFYVFSNLGSQNVHGEEQFNLLFNVLKKVETANLSKRIFEPQALKKVTQMLWSKNVLRGLLKSEFSNIKFIFNPYFKLIP